MSGITVVSLERSKPHKRGSSAALLREAARLLEQQVKQPLPGAPDWYHLKNIQSGVSWALGRSSQDWKPREPERGPYRLNDPENGGAEIVAYVVAIVSAVACDLEGLDLSDKEVKKCLLQIDAAAGYLIAEQA